VRFARTLGTKDSFINTIGQPSPPAASCEAGAPSGAASANQYWEERKDILYYQVVRTITGHISKRAKSIIDVGSAGCPYLDWFGHIPQRTSIDLTRPYEAEGVSSYTGDFLKWKADRHYDIVTCLQVLEHVPDAAAFAQKLLSLGKVVVVSVPYKWPAGKTKSHVHDPVDEGKLLSWFGRRPNFEYICREVKAPVERIVQVYDEFPDSWSALNRRDGIIAELKAKSSAKV